MLYFFYSLLVGKIAFVLNRRSFISVIVIRNPHALQEKRKKISIGFEVHLHNKNKQKKNVLTQHLYHYAMELKELLNNITFELN